MFFFECHVLSKSLQSPAMSPDCRCVKAFTVLGLGPGAVEPARSAHVPRVLGLVWMVLLTSFRPCGPPIPDIQAPQQDHVAYLQAASADVALLPPEEQLRQVRVTTPRFFSPWHRTSPLYTREEVEVEFREGFGNRVRGKRRRPTIGLVRQVYRMRSWEGYPNSGAAAITSSMPTCEPFPPGNPTSASAPVACDYPFDRFQQTVAANTPLWVSMQAPTAPGSWRRLDSTYGWIPAPEGRLGGRRVRAAMGSGTLRSP